MTKNAIGIDLGGTYTKLALIDSKGKIKHRSRLSTADFDSRDSLLEAISREIRSLIRKAGLTSGNIEGVGIGVPGLVDFNRGLVYGLTNVRGWKNTPLKLLLERKLKMPVLVDNDVNIMALGECKFGAGRGARDAVCITLGTGVGGGIIIDGSLYRGATFSAGEVGHMPLKEDGLACNCGGYGCLERYVGNRHIASEMKSAIRAGRAPGVKAMVKGDLSSVTPEIISSAARKGDKAAIALWDKIGKRIGTTLSGIVNLLNPEMIIIGGGVADAGEPLFGPIRQTVKRRSMRVPGRAVKILKAKLGNDAGMIGAAALFF